MDEIEEEIINSYSEIVLFLKNEYLKIVEIEKNNNSNDNSHNKKINIKLNLLILDKIKIYVEEAFNYIINNYYKREKILYIGKKIQLIQKQIEDFKLNFNVDKYLKNPDLYKSTIHQKRNNSLNINGQINSKNGEDNNNDKKDNTNNQILNGNFNGSK